MRQRRQVESRARSPAGTPQPHWTPTSAQADTDIGSVRDLCLAGPGGLRPLQAPGALLAAQRTAGNAAVAQLVMRDPGSSTTVMRQPLPGSPEAGPRPLAVTLTKGIEQELAQARAERLAAQRQVDDLEEQAAALRSAKAQVPAGDAERITELKTQLGVLDATIKAGEADLATIRGPASDAKELNALLARRGAKVSTREATTDNPDTRQLTGKGVVWSRGSQSTRLDGSEAGSKATTVDKTRKTTLGAGTLNVVDSSKTTTAEGSKATSVENTTGKTVDLLDQSYTKTTAKRTTGDTLPGEPDTESKKKYGLGGYESTNVETTRSGTETKKTSTTKKITRGDGQIGAAGNKTWTKGAVDAEGNLTKGSEGKIDAKAFVTVDPAKGIGGGGEAGGDYKRVDGPRSFSGGGSLSGKVLLNVAQVPGKDPPQFKATLTIFFGVKGKAGGAYDKKLDAEKGLASGGGSATAGISGGASAGVTASFTHILDEVTAKHYIEAVQSGGAGAKPKYPEWRILEVGQSSGWPAACEMYQAMLGKATAADDAAMKEGQAVSVVKELAADGKVSLGGKTGAGSSLGVEYGKSVKGSITITKTMLAGNVIQYTVNVSSEDGSVAGAKAGTGAASAGATFGSTAGKGRSVSFKLKTDDASFAARRARILGASSMEEVEQLARDPDLSQALDELTETRSKSSSETINATIGVLDIEAGGTGSLDEEVKKDAAGEMKSSKVTGAYKSGGTVGIGNIKAGDSTREEYIGEVENTQVADEKGNVRKKQVAKGDLTKTTTASSLDKTVDSVTSALKKGSIAPLFGNSVKDETKSEGHKIHDADLRSVIYRAKGDLATWMKPVVSSQLRPLWQKCRAEIRAACPGDDEAGWDLSAVQRALATYRSEAFKGANEAILSSAGGGGFAYHFPAGTESMKPLFDKIVGGYPAQKAEVLKAEGKLAEAKAECDAQLADAKTLIDYLKANADKFDAGKHASMLDGATQARAKLSSLRLSVLGSLNPAKEAARPLPPDVAGPPTVDQQEAAAAEKEQARIQFQDKMAVCERWQRGVQQSVGAAEAELNRGAGWSLTKADIGGIVIPKLNQAKELLSKWETSYWAAFRIMEQYGFDRTALEKLHPHGLKQYYQSVYDRSLRR